MQVPSEALEVAKFVQGSQLSQFDIILDYVQGFKSTPTYTICLSQTDINSNYRTVIRT